jgi:hypothetical protein
VKLTRPHDRDLHARHHRYRSLERPWPKKTATWFALSEQRPLEVATRGGPEAVGVKASQNWPRQTPKTPLLDISWPVDDGRRYRA